MAAFLAWAAAGFPGAVVLADAAAVEVDLVGVAAVGDFPAVVAAAEGEVEALVAEAKGVAAFPAASDLKRWG